MSILDKLFGKSKPKPEVSRFPLVAPAQNPWSVPVIDVRAITHQATSTTANPQMAANATSFQGDDGTGFIGQAPATATATVTTCELRYRTDGHLYPGALFLPATMEHKWAIYFHDQHLIFIRSWQRRVELVAKVTQTPDELVVESITGTLADDTVDPARTVDFLLRTHALALHYPVPLPADLEEDPEAAAHWCMSRFGNLAACATTSAIPFESPDKPLRSHSLLHVAAARGQLDQIRQLVADGVPVNLLAADAMTPLHWAVGTKQAAPVIQLLLELGADPALEANGKTPADLAADSGNQPLLALLQGNA